MRGKESFADLCLLVQLIVCKNCFYCIFIKVVQAERNRWVRRCVLEIKRVAAYNSISIYVLYSVSRGLVPPRGIPFTIKSTDLQHI